MRSGGCCSSVPCLCVCSLVRQHLTSGVSFHFENAVAYSTGNEGRISMGISLKAHCRKNPALPTCTAILRSLFFVVPGTQTLVRGKLDDGVTDL